MSDGVSAGWLAAPGAAERGHPEASEEPSRTAANAASRYLQDAPNPLHAETFVEDLAAQLQRLETKLQSVEDDNRGKLQRVEAKLQRVEAKLQRVEADNEGLRADNEGLRAELEAVKAQSRRKSWL
jgi:septal ring factor EnvC (AmiA/AmiB activator)